MRRLARVALMLVLGTAWSLGFLGCGGPATDSGERVQFEDDDDDFFGDDPGGFPDDGPVGGGFDDGGDFDDGGGFEDDFDDFDDFEF